MILIDEIHSKIDNTVKFVLQLDDGLITEVSYINKNDGKDIICIPTQTSCAMECSFCHISEYSDDIILRNLTEKEMFDFVDYLYNTTSLELKNKTLLISYMGLGEPLLNYSNVVESMCLIRSKYDSKFENVRFAISTSLPSVSNLYLLSSEIVYKKLNVKLHVSLHYTNDFTRERNMPRACSICHLIGWIQIYRHITDLPIEIHYTLIENYNDSISDAENLMHWFKDSNIVIKFIKFNNKNGKESSKDYNYFYNVLAENKIPFEVYTPPGIDIGASCGQFIKDYYLEYNRKK